MVAVIPSELMQEGDDRENIDGLFKDASRARKELMAGVARQWELMDDSTFLRHPVKGSAASFVQLDAIDPEIKGKERALEKVKSDYEGDVRRLKDLARMTIV